MDIPSSTVSTYSAVVAVSNPVLQTTSTKTTLNESVRRAVLIAVHTEMQTKQARERNIVITGLRRSNTTQDMRSYEKSEDGTLTPRMMTTGSNTRTTKSCSL